MEPKTRTKSQTKSQTQRQTQIPTPKQTQNPNPTHLKPEPTGGLGLTRPPVGFFWNRWARRWGWRRPEFQLTATAAASQQLSQSGKRRGPSRTGSHYLVRGDASLQYLLVFELGPPAPPRAALPCMPSACSALPSTHPPACLRIRGRKGCNWVQVVAALVWGCVGAGGRGCWAGLGSGTG